MDFPNRAREEQKEKARSNVFTTCKVSFWFLVDFVIPKTAL
jgi:hypothetical protein